MAKRLFLHVGTPKTGTTYLQSVLWAGKAALQSQGLLLPLDRVRDHYFLSNIGRDDAEDLTGMPPRGLTAWDRMLDQVRSWPDDVLISHELFAMTAEERAPWIIDSLAAVSEEVHPVITARDLARQIPAEWQQTVKHGRTHGLRQYYRMVRSRDETILFWNAQDLTRQVRMWTQGVPDERVHLVTVPPSGADVSVLWERFAGVVGVDPSSVDTAVSAPNESLGVVEIELLRQVNEHGPADASKPLQQMLTRQVLADDVLAARPGSRRFGTPPEEHAWVVEKGASMVQELRSFALDVVGDLDELLPSVAPLDGPIPDDVTADQLAPVAVEAISAALYRTHERATAGLRADVERLRAEVERQRETLGRRTARIGQLESRARHLERGAKAAWDAYDVERRLPLWRKLGRRVKSVGRIVVRRHGDGPTAASEPRPGR